MAEVAKVNKREEEQKAAIPSGILEPDHGIVVDKTFTINRTPEEIYEFFRDTSNLTKVTKHLERVENRGGGKTHWRASGPFGAPLEWDAEVIDQKPGRWLSWRSVDGSEVENIGMVQFKPAPGRRGTEVHIVLKYSIPMGKITSSLAKIFGEDPQKEIKEDLRRLKSWLEAGEIPTIEGQPVGHCGRES